MRIVCEIMPLLNPMTVFGTIFLVITIISGMRMKTKVDNPNCPEEVKSVEYNKRVFPIVIGIDVFIILIGLLLYFL